MSLESRKEYTRVMATRYKAAGRAYRRHLLDEVCEMCGYSRKYAIKKLNGSIPVKTGKRGRKTEYGDDKELVQVLKRIWLKSGQLCGKRLKNAIPLWMAGYEKRYGSLAEETRTKLKRISPASIDRVLKPYRAQVLRKNNTGTKPGTLLKNLIPIRTSNKDIKSPGFLEVDTVAHCGGSMSGSFIWSITYTDIYSGWTLNAPIWNKGSEWVLYQTREMEKRLPFTLHGFDVDNGSEFITHHLYRYLKSRGVPVEFTRSRPYRKNDNAHVEQKNWTHVRELLGYDRLEQPEMIMEMEKLYHYAELLNNYFKPSFKLKEKVRKKSRYIKKYYSPQTPYERLLSDDSIDEAQKNKLRKQLAKLDPFNLDLKIQAQLRKIEKMKQSNTSDFFILPPGEG